MKVILLTDVPKVGNKYDIKDLKEGYAQNVLIAKGLAVLATPTELAKINERKKQIEKKKNDEVKSFMDLIDSVNNKTITIKAKANDKGNLFKAIGPHDVKTAIKNIVDIDLEENLIIMDHLKSVGSYTISIKKGDKRGECKIVIEAI